MRPTYLDLATHIEEGPVIAKAGDNVTQADKNLTKLAIIGNTKYF